MKRVLLFFAIFLIISCKEEEGLPVTALGPLPSAAQLEYQKMELNAFIHFNINTFTNKEWGYGDESPEIFNPEELDVSQWLKVIKEAGMKGVVITAKHHDGFCLWPSKYTEHSVKNSPWKEGNGDLLKELSEACKANGIKFGVYISPWDRNHPDYGKPAYLEYFRNQIRELLTNYGEVYELWFDGANGGDGYYGGANEVRKVDKQQYYEWEKTIEIVRELQPKTLIFSDAGPDVRWAGNENGKAYQETWSMLNRNEVYPGMIEYAEQYARGQENGTHWVPAEANVSTRPGWYYHNYEDHKVKSLAELYSLYHQSIGQNATLLVNFPVNTDGLIPNPDAEVAIGLGAKIKEDFTDNLAINAAVRSTNHRGSAYAADQLIDQNQDSYWAPEDTVKAASIILDFKRSIDFNRIVLQEQVELGQRIKSFSVDIFKDNNWINIANEKTVGYKRILKLDRMQASKIRINILDSRACPTLSEVGVYNAPYLLTPPKITRFRKGSITMTVPERGPSIHYTTDGSTPTPYSPVFRGGIRFTRTALLKAIAVDGERQSEVTTASFDLSSTKWYFMNVNTDAVTAIDGNIETWWTHPEGTEKDELVIDLNENIRMRGFTYVPMQERYMKGVITKYSFYTSEDGVNYEKQAEGEFANIVNNPVEQRVTFNEIRAKYIKLKTRATHDGSLSAFAEIGVITK